MMKNGGKKIKILTQSNKFHRRHHYLLPRLSLKTLIGMNYRLYKDNNDNIIQSWSLILKR